MNAMQWLSALIWLIFVCTTLVACVGNFKNALLQLLVYVLVSPVLAVGGWTVRIELVLVPLLLGIYAINNPGRFLSVFTRLCSILAVSWLGWVVISSLLNGGVGIVASWAWWLDIYGLARLVMVFWLFSMFRWGTSEGRLVKKLFAVTAIPLAILSAAQVVNLGGARELTAAAFVPATSPVFQNQVDDEAKGYVFRGLGVFGNVSPNGFYFAMVSGCCLLALLNKRGKERSRERWLWLACGCFAVLGGMSTMSGTFIAGLPIVVALCFWLSRKRVTFRQLCWSVGAVLAAVALTISLVNYIPRLKAQYAYQIAGLTTGERFKSRYDDEIGVTREAASMVSNNPLLGGFGLEKNVFVGDSIFTLLGFYGGYVGAGVFAMFVLALYVRMRRGEEFIDARLWLVGAFVFGMSTTGLFTLRMSDWWWAIMGIASNWQLDPGASEAHSLFVRGKGSVASDNELQARRRLVGRTPLCGLGRRLAK
jgi:hypothetical protein